MPCFDPLSPAWSRMPPVEIAGDARIDGNRILVPTSAGLMILTLHPFGVRVRLGPAPSYDYGILEGEPATVPPTLRREGEGLCIDGGGVTVRLGHAPLTLTLRTGGRDVVRPPGDGHFVREHRLPPLARVDGGWFFALDLVSGEPLYGLGEKWGRLDRRGQIVRSLATDALGVNAEVSYKNTPFIWSPEGWGAFVHTPCPVLHGAGFAPWSQRTYAALVEDETLDVFLLAGADGATLLRHYTGLTGRAPMPPAWSFGTILSKAYYRTADELLETARAVRARGMPCDTITLDGRAWQDTETRFAFEWDPTRYPDPGKVMAELKALDFRVCVWEYPLVSVRNRLFDDMAARGWLIRDRRTGEAYRYQWDMEPFGAVLTPLPESGLVDFTHPDAYAFWRDSHEPLFALGVDMIKSDFGEQVEPDMVAANGDDGHRLRNVYPLLYNRCVYEAARCFSRSGPFLFGRSGWAGSQRYPIQWGGDPQADWEGLAASLRGGLSWGLSGGPFYASDVGGFYKDRRDGALYVRWLQAAIFASHLRLHGIGAREPWSYGAEIEPMASAAIEMRYRLLPYLRHVAAEASATGLPVQRPMVLAFPDDRASWAFEEQFMCGPDLLVAPCVRPDGRVDAYLPEGEWVWFPSGRPIQGGRVHRLTLPLAETAVFARLGAEIPLAEKQTHIGEETPAIALRWQASHQKL